MKKRSESDVVRSICNYLALKKYKFWRQNNVGIYDPVGKRFRSVPKHCIKGVPDIFCLRDSETWGIEVKCGEGKQSPDQKEFEKMWCTSESRKYAVVWDIQDIINLGF